MVKSSWDDADWIWNYELLLYLEAILNIVGSYVAPPLPESMLVWVGGHHILCAADIPTLIWEKGKGEIGIVPALLTMIVVLHVHGYVALFCENNLRVSEVK